MGGLITIVHRQSQLEASVGEFREQALRYFPAVDRNATELAVLKAQYADIDRKLTRIENKLDRGR